MIGDGIVAQFTGRKVTYLAGPTLLTRAPSVNAALQAFAANNKFIVTDDIPRAGGSGGVTWE